MALWTAPGCSREDSDPRAHDSASEGLRILWVVLDATPASALGVYGYARETSPHVDALAEQSVIFERAYSQAPSTLSSTSSFLTGRYPMTSIRNGKLVGPTGVQRLAELGYRTVAFSENPWVSPRFGFDDGFAEFFPVSGQARVGPGFFSTPDSHRTIDLVLEWLHAHRRDRFFVYLHLLPPHAPYAPPAPFLGRFEPSEVDFSGPGGELLRLATAGTKPGDQAVVSNLLLGRTPLPAQQLDFLRARYDENLAFADHQVGRLVAALRRLSLLERTILIVSSDHGEAFGQHGQLSHASSLYDEQTRVPLLIRFPESFGNLGTGGKRWSEPVQLLDIMPTLLDASGVSDAEADGTSLLPRLRSGRASGAVARSFLGSGGSSVVSGAWKLIAREGVELYDLDADPSESDELSARHPDRVAELLSDLMRSDGIETGVRASEIDPATKAELEALGYLMGPEGERP